MAIILTPDEWQRIETKEGMEAILTRVCALAMEDSLRVLPTVIKSLVAQTSLLKKTSDTFYANNKDLLAHKELVSKVTEELEAKSPGQPLEKLLNEAAIEVRRRLVGMGKISHTGPKPDLETLDHLAGMFEGGK
jgi:hypothetical protein